MGTNRSVVPRGVGVLTAR